LTYASPRAPWTKLAEVDVGAAGDARTWFAAGRPASSWSLVVEDGSGTGGETRITTVPADAAGGRVKVSATDFRVQEGARRFVSSGGRMAVSLRNFTTLDLDRETNADVMLLVTLRVWKSPGQGVISAVGTGGTGRAAIWLDPAEQFIRYGIPLRCLRDKGADMKSLGRPFMLSVDGPADFAIGEVRLGTDAEKVMPCRDPG
jgi:beta-glucosidase